MSKSKYGTLFENLIFFLVNTVATKFVGYILLPIYTAYMTTEQYGMADILISTNNLIYPIVMLGMGSAVIRYCMEEKQDRVLVFSSAAIVLGTMSIASMILIPIVKFFPGYKEYAVFVPLMAISLNCMSLASSLCKAVNKTKLVVQNNIVYGSVMLISAIVTLKVFHLGVYGYLCTYILANLASTVYLSVSVKVTRYFSLKYSRPQYVSQIRNLLRYGVPLVPNSLAAWVIQLSDRYMVAYWHGSAMNGLYAVAYKIPSIIRAVINVFIQAWQLSAIQEYEKEDSAKFYNSIYSIYCMLGYLLTAGMILMTRPLAMILFSREFYVAWKYVPLLLIASVLESQEAFFATFYLASGKTNKYFVSTGVGAVANIGFNVLLIPKYSATGASLATAISRLIVFIQRAVYAKKNMNIQVYMTKNILALVLLSVETILYTTEIIPQMWGTIGSIIIVIAMIVLFSKEIVGFMKLILKKVMKKENK